jgi:hypothetical protein
MSTFALSLPSLFLFPLSVALASAQPKEIHRTLPLDLNGEFSLKTFKGDVKLVAWDRPEVKLDARIEADPSCGDDAYQAEQVKNTQIEIRSSPTAVQVSTEYPQQIQYEVQGCSSSPFVSYQISVPATARVQVLDHKSKIQISNLRADLRVQTHKGQLDISGLEGALNLETHKGQGRATFSKWAHASRFETHKGNLEIVIPKGSGINLDASLGRRGQLESDLVGSLERTGVSRRSVRIQRAINGGGPELILTTNKGTFHLLDG